jgi:Tol biopolymer transport system component
VDGADDITSIIIVDPSGQVQTITPASGTSWWRDDDHTVHCDWPTTVWEWRDQGMGQPPDTGPYTVIAADASGNRSSLITPAVPPAPRPRPELLAPAPDSVIHTTTPTFQWTPGPPSLTYVLELYDEGAGWGQPVWRCELGGHTQAVYNFDGRARRKELEPNHAYSWVVAGGRGSDVRVSDPRVSVVDYYRVERRFTVYGDWPGRPPELPGKLAYTACSRDANRQDAIAYNTNAAIRSYLPGAEWSPDGAKVVYSFFGRIWIDSLDGSPPVLVPGTSGVGECRWAPDGKSIVYSNLGPWSPFFGAGSLNAEYQFAWEPWHLSGKGPGPMDGPWRNNDVWVTTIDGSRRYPLADSVEHDERWPAWSPDGLWIAYRRLPGPKEFRRAEPGVLSEGYRVGVWVARYDGTDQHPLVSSGVVGHPEYTPDPYLHTAAWSPDGRTLAVQFSTRPGDGAWAIGVMSAQGGPITPVFIPSPGAKCCAGPRFPQWSPDGTKIVFASGHHLSSMPAKGEFVLGTELWMANADGSGEPIRLTYDSLHESWSSWWAANTEPGSTVKVLKGDASVTFESVAESGSTSLVAYLDAAQSLPEGFEFARRRYELATTAKVSGAISLEIHYDQSGLPPGQEARLRLLHREGDGWVDVTAGSVDTESHVIRGRCTTQGAFTLAIAR